MQSRKAYCPHCKKQTRQWRYNSLTAWSCRECKGPVNPRIQMTKRKKSLFSILAKLDWIKIMQAAIESRESSWAQNPIIEWRNAGDTVFCAILNALRKEGIDPYKTCIEET